MDSKRGLTYMLIGFQGCADCQAIIRKVRSGSTLKTFCRFAEKVDALCPLYKTNLFVPTQLYTLLQLVVVVPHYQIVHEFLNSF